MAPEPEAQGEGNFLTRRIAGMPAFVWVGGAALLAYLLFFRGARSSGNSSSGGGGTSTTGDVSFTPGTTSVTITGGGTANGPVATGTTGTHNPQPKPVPPPRKKIVAVTHRTYTVKTGDTLKSIAAKFRISIVDLAHANVYVPGEVPGDQKVGQRLGTGAGLKVGQVLVIPGT